VPGRVKAAKPKEPPSEKVFIAAIALDFPPSIVIYRSNQSLKSKN
jgi:hypothetical protein